jgi:hypothetical protein
MLTWSRKFAEPIALKDGRVVATLSDARALLLTLPERYQLQAHWQYAGELLLNAAEHKSGLTDAWAQLRRALIVEGML